MGKSIQFLGALCVLYFSFTSCHGTIWKTEDAYIIDDELDSENDDGAPKDANPNACVTADGVHGQCVPVEECNPFYKFFSDHPERLSKAEIYNKYLNMTSGMDKESCEPGVRNFLRRRRSEDSAEDGSKNYVCCTSLKYVSMKSTTLKEYLLKEGRDEENYPEIPLATASTLDLAKVVNGQQARLGEFPYTVAIIHGGRQICGGSLMEAGWVLSAAHCFDRFTPAAVRSLKIKIGDHDIASAGEVQHQDVSVSKLFLHPGFFRGPNYFRDDVALIKLKTPAQLLGHVRAVSLHTGSPNIHSGSWEAIVCGWGLTCPSSSQCSTSRILRKAKLPIVANSVCSQRYSGTQAPPITQNMICAGGRGTSDACNGDSGGPLIISDAGSVYQIGIVSWGIGCGQYPGVYTRVSSYLNWIAKHKNKP